MKFYERQFHGIFLDPSITRTETRTDLVGQSYEITCTRIAFYDKNTGEAKTAWAALTTTDNGKVIQLMGHGENIVKNKAYRMMVWVKATAPQEAFTKKSAPFSYYIMNLLFFPFTNEGDYFNKMLNGENVSWPKDTIFPVYSLLSAFYR
ncbi:MAG: hypothetical protein C4583_13620 [Anaerolineaceae bacterium]|nr:MAG: hypothetical protein C4583_13620 [Anaerolineaceae bacterium]